VIYADAKKRLSRKGTYRWKVAKPKWKESTNRSNTRESHAVERSKLIGLSRRAGEDQEKERGVGGPEGLLTKRRRCRMVIDMKTKKLKAGLPVSRIFDKAGLDRLGCYNWGDRREKKKSQKKEADPGRASGRG